MSGLAAVPAFASEDDFLFAAMGVLAARAEMARARIVLAPPTQPTIPSDDEPVLHALLGLVHLVEYGGAIVESWALVASAVTTESARRPAHVEPRDILR